MQKKILRTLLFVALPAALIAVGLVAGSFYAGYALGVKNPEAVIVKGITNIGDPDAKADFNTFWEAWKKLTEYHFDGEKLGEQDVVYGAIKGITERLQDPNTVFLEPEDRKKFEDDVRGSFGGIGAEIGVRNNILVVVAPLKGSPAERAGLKSGDKILKIGEQGTDGLDVNDAVKRIRGPIGTDVTLTIVRGEDAPKEYLIVREEIKVPTLEWALMGDHLLHVKLFSFNENALALFRNAVVDAASTAGGIHGIILDLRNNPGGFLDVAIDLAGWFLDGDSVVTIKESRGGEEEVFRAGGNGLLRRLPVTILINQGSASASEILAGALRDNRGVKLVGARSFGKGTVQELFPLHDGSSLKITIAHWLTPKRQSIEKNGLAPDVEVKVPEEETEKGETPKDVQLEKAIEVLQGEIKTIASRGGS